MFTRYTWSSSYANPSACFWSGPCITLLIWGCNDATTPDAATSNGATTPTENTRDAHSREQSATTKHATEVPSNTGVLETSSHSSTASDAMAGTNDDGALPEDAALDASVDNAPDPPLDAAPGQIFDQDADSHLAPILRARATYREWQPRTQQPVHISAEIFSLCRLPNLPETAFVESIHGHDLALQDWLDEGALAGFALFTDNTDTSTNPEALSFPVGATIVKEKLAYIDGEWQLFALGFMLKREPGFDPANADWQFGYWEESNDLWSGISEQRHCGSCHALASTDHVYVDQSWRWSTVQQRP